LVFQPAHVMEDHDYIKAEKGGKMDIDVMIHTLKTTCNFGVKSKLLTWYSGGLNHQIEHHLFPQICHVNYPAVSRILESTCREYGVRYLSHDTVLDAVRSHYRWLRRMGNEQTAA